MLTSGEVAQMFAAQNQSFMGQNQFAQQIGISNTGMSLADFGTQSGQKAFGAGGTFGGHSPVSFSPGGMGGPSFGGGTRMAGGAMSLMGGGMSALSSMAFDPMTAGLAGTGIAPSIFGRSAIGTMAGGGMAGGMAAGAAMMLPAYAAQKAIGAYVGGAQQQQQIGSALGGFQFQNSGSRTGQGFSRDDAQQIGNQVRAIAHVPEMMTSVEELTKLIPKLKSSGMMQGVRDASEFNSRFKEAVKTLRDVSKVMGTSMEEATQFFEHSRSVGFLGRTDQIKNAMNVQFTSAQTGMSQQQVMGLQQSGAQMAVGRGVRRQAGATAVTNMAQQFGRGMQSGNISQSDLEDMTGATGEAAVGAAAQQMTEKLARFAESTAAGKASMMGLAEFDEKGRYKGINKELAQRYAAGDVSKEDLMRRIAGFSSQQKIAATRKVGSMAIEFAGATGPGGAMSFMRNVLAEGGHTGESAKYMMQKSGFSEVEVDVMSQMEGAGMGGGGDDRRKKAFERKRQMEADISERTDPSKIMSRIGAKLKSGSGLAKVEQEGSKMFTFIGKAYDEFVDDVVGRYSIELSEKGSQRLLQSFQSQKGREDMRALFAMKLPQYSTANSSSSVGKAFGLLTGTGNLGGKLLDKGASSLMGAFGRAGKETAGDVDQQREYMQGHLGMRGKEDSDVNARMKELQGMGGGSSEAKAQVQKLIYQLDRDGKFSEADQATKIQMLTDAARKTNIRGAGENPIQKLIREKGLGKGGANPWTEAIIAATDKDIISSDVDSQESRMRDSAKKFSKSIQAADIHLRDVAGEDTAGTLSSVIASDYQVGINLMHATNPDVKKAIESGKGEAGARALEKALGKTEGSISEAEFRQTQEAHRKIMADLSDPNLTPEERAKKTEDILGAIGSRVIAEYSKDIGVSQIAARDVAAGMGKGDLKTAFMAFATAQGGEAAVTKQDELRGVIEKQSTRFMDARKELAEARTPEARRAAQEKLRGITKELGSEVTERIGATSAQFESKARGVVGQTLTTSRAAEELGVSEEDIQQFATGKGPDAKVKLDKATLEKIKQSKVASDVQAQALTGSPAQKAQAKDEKMMKTLDSIDSTNKELLSATKQLTTFVAVSDKTGKVAEYQKSEDSKKADAEAKGGKK